MAEKYAWKYASVGGVVRVKIESGEDIAHLGELDKTKWTVLSCPVAGLQFDQKTLQLLDTDGDGKIRVDEIVSAAQWLTSVVKDKDSILKGDSEIALAGINEENPEGKKLQDSARQILSVLGLEKDTIAIADTADSVAIFAKTLLNGDGVVTPASAAGDEALAAAITAGVTAFGGVMDRSGVFGVDKDTVEKLYTALADYSAWKAAADADKANVLPYGDNTEAALAACEALKDKIADYFMRCKLITFNAAVAGAVDVSAEKIGAISDKNLATCSDEIASYPLARPSADGLLPFAAINPAWQAQFAALKSLVLDVDFAGKDSITEAEWQATLAKFAAYNAWKGAKKGAEVEGLGLDAVKALLAADKKNELLALIEKDLALKSESESIDAVDKLLHLYRDFAKLLHNYVVFSDFYGRNGEAKAVFEVGKLFIDERCCNLCLEVSGTGNHAEAAGLSGMFLIYCTCTSKKLGKTKNIVAVMTDGKVFNLRPGKNAIFYDREGNDWDAVITKIVDNPISVKQAFWGPYRKLAKFINDKIDKSASEKDSAATADLLAKADKADATKPAQPFDIAKFTGIFAAISLAFAALAAAFAGIVASLTGLAWWQYILIIVCVMLVISGPACFIAWKKLRKRDLGPVLNANGWAINSKVLVNIMFGGTLTTLAKYPIVKGVDPFVKKSPWKKVLAWILAILVLAGAVLFYLHKTGKCPCCCKAETEEVVLEAETAPTDTTVAAVAAEESAAEQTATE